MARVAASLREMGAEIVGEGGGLPMTVTGARLVGRAHDLPVASAQWKSAILLAGTTAEGVTIVREPYLSRDHTERMLPLFGVPVVRSGGDVSVRGGSRLHGTGISVPADPSSAAFLAVASIITGGTFVGEDLLSNPTRIGAYPVMRRMGANVQEERMGGRSGEEWSRVIFSARAAGDPDLRGTDVTAAEFPSLLDEVPILGVLAAHAQGRTRFFGVRELRAKESDRVESTARMLRGFGVRVEEEEDVLTVYGGREAHHIADVDAESDHRIAMAATVMALTVSGVSQIRSFDSVAQSFPGFAAWLGDRAGPVG